MGYEGQAGTELLPHQDCTLQKVSCLVHADLEGDTLTVYETREVTSLAHS